SCCDAQAACAMVGGDPFGDLFVTYLNRLRVTLPVLGAFDINRIEVALSTGGGITFSPLYESAPSISRADGPNYDQPSIAIGPDPTAAFGSVWISYHVPDGGIVAQGAAINGLGAGAIGPFTAAQRAPFSGLFRASNFGGVAVGPTGKVMVTYQQFNVGGTGPSVIFVAVNNGLTDPSFGLLPIPVTFTNVGGQTPIPAQPNRNIDAEANLTWE